MARSSSFSLADLINDVAVDSSSPSSTSISDSIIEESLMEKVEDSVTAMDSSDSSVSSVSFIADRTIVIPAWKPQLDPFVFGTFRGIEGTREIAAEAAREIATKEMKKESEIKPQMVIPVAFPMKINNESIVSPQVRPPLHDSASIRSQFRELGFGIGNSIQAGDFAFDGNRRPIPKPPPEPFLRGGVLCSLIVLVNRRGGVLPRFLVVPANRPPAKPPDATFSTIPPSSASQHRLARIFADRENPSHELLRFFLARRRDQVHLLCFPVRPPRKPPEFFLRGGDRVRRPPAKPPDAASVARRRSLLQAPPSAVLTSAASSSLPLTRAVSFSLTRAVNRVTVTPFRWTHGVTVTRLVERLRVTEFPRSLPRSFSLRLFLAKLRSFPCAREASASSSHVQTLASKEKAWKWAKEVVFGLQQLTGSNSSCQAQFCFHFCNIKKKKKKASLIVLLLLGPA